MSENMSSMQEEERMEAKSPGKKKKWSAWMIVLVILSLPIVVPIALVAAGCILALALALGGGLLAVIVGVLCCVIMLIAALAAVLVCAFIGIGFGIVMLSSAPASGIAVTGTSLMILGAGILGCLLLAGFWSLFLKMLTVCGCSIRRLFGRKREGRFCDAA